MMLLLENYIEYISEKELRCDASEMFFDVRGKDCNYTANEAAILFKCRKRMIFNGDKALYFEVLDTDGGEYYELNCREDMHNLMLKYRLYPPLILSAFKNLLCPQ